MAKKTIREQLLAKLHILLKQTNSYEFRKDMYSGYGVDTAADLTKWQLEDLIDRLDEQYNGMIRTYRRKAATLLTQIGVYYEDEGETSKIAWIRANEFLKQPEIAKKAIYNLTKEELIALTKKLIAIKGKGYTYDRESKKLIAEKNLSGTKEINR